MSLRWILSWHTDSRSCEVSGGTHHRFSNQGFSSFFSEPVGSFRERHLKRAATLPFSLLRDAASISQNLRAELNRLKRLDVPLFDRQTFSASPHRIALWGSKLPEALQAQRRIEFFGSFAVKLQVPLVFVYLGSRDGKWMERWPDCVYCRR